MKTKILKYLFRTFLVFSIALVTLFFYVFYSLTSVVIFSPKSGAGIGNQLFQYSAAYSLARETSSKLFIITKHSQKKLNGDILNDNRHFALNKFNIRSHKILSRHSSVDGFVLNLLFIKKFSTQVNLVLSFFGRKIEFVNDRNFFDLAKSAKNKIYIIDDTFESEVFFKKYSDEIKQILKAQSKNLDKLTPYLSKLNDSKSFCVHVRRGDVSKTENSIYFTSIDYQKQAIALARQLVVDSKFYIFTDSPEIVKEELNDNNIEFISNKELTSIDDFVLMNSCGNNIITRSTFSWWAAYLNLNPNKIVIAPNPRYSKELIDSSSNDPIVIEQKRELYTNHAYPESWIKLNYTLKRIE